jgi:Flp pilus assembly protein protease CpaA
MTQLLTGLALVGIAEAALDRDLDHMKIGIKLVVLLVITGLVWANRRKESISTGVWAAIGGLTVANIVIAVFV